MLAERAAGEAKHTRKRHITLAERAAEQAWYQEKLQISLSF
jgi:hypothetical protein